ncbi:glutathione S-transferase C-terminal domain-containing protein [Prochlorococcus sp. MIT 1300]|uniref:glutathione S-transferase C-terminal domain-containing protein n=1 Tax=Prochlorococcus sp. MIT 1300 TaxID=3096218 RepID=UPI002A74EE48|nr:glutathione S-transferase C-terminal domain-containing protein [Prochlorococcus sp. MIT 1300]
MSIPPAVVAAARCAWKWQWNQLMNGLAPADSKGNYQRPPSQHQKAQIPILAELTKRPKEQLPRLIIGRSCPWAHRTWLMHCLRGLSESITLLVANADHKSGRWTINPPWLKQTTLLGLYEISGAPPKHRATVPTLIDPGEQSTNPPVILGNESAQLVEALNQWPTSKDAMELAPENLKEEINNWQKLIQPTVNDGVYRCGFARNQAAYDKASKQLFDTLRNINTSLSLKGPWLCGEKLTIADVRLFPTLIRWEIVYSPLFGCSQEPLWSFDQIWEWRQRFFALQGVAETCNADIWRKDYFGALFPLRPSSIVPSGPDLSKITNSSSPYSL